MPGITVGVDGSEDSRHALEWAMKEAAIRGTELNVIAVYEVAASYWTGNPIVLPEDRAGQEKAARAAEEEVARIADQLGDSQPASVSVRSTVGFAANELIDASRDSDLVVVGSRGGGAFARMLLGSVSMKLVEHSACPVVVIPGTR